MNSKTLFYMVCVTVASMQAAEANAKAANKKHMNVLFIMADDLRPEMGCYGVKDIHTPNFDRFAKGAVLFDNAFCNAPVSGASRASVLTGMYPNYPTRFIDYTCKASVDAPDAIPISGWLTSHGYHTVSNGKIMHHIEDHADSWSESPWPGIPMVMMYIGLSTIVGSCG